MRGVIVKCVLVVTALVLAFGAIACTGPRQVEKPDSTKEALAGGLAQLRPYDFGERTRNGIRWFENYALNNPQSEASYRARYEILRARVDWLTVAYIEENPDARVDGLIALMEHLGLEHSKEIGNQDVFAVVEVLENQAKGLSQIEEYAAAAGSALFFLSMFRHLDLAPGYFEAAIALGLRSFETEGEGPPFARMGSRDFSINALLIVLADLSTHLPAIEKLDTSRRSHAYAQVLAFGCPKGFVSFAEAALEERESRLVEACKWPCGQTDAEGKAPSAACPKQVKTPAVLYSLDNEVTLRALSHLPRLRAFAKRVVALDRKGADDYPIFDGREELLERLLKNTAVTQVPLSLPEREGRTLGDDLKLQGVRYAPWPEPSPLLLISYKGALHVSASPWAVADETGTLVVKLAEDDPRVAWSFPGKALPADFDDNLSGTSELGPLLGEMRQLLEAQARVYGTSLEELVARTGQPPTLLLDASTPVATLRALALALHRVGYKNLQIAVSDRDFSRAGALAMRIVPEAAPTTPLVTLDEGALTFAAKASDKKPRSFARANKEAALPASELYLAIFPEAARAPQELVKQLAIEAKSGTVGDLVSTVDALRYWRKVEPGSTGLDVTAAAPQDAGGVPKFMVGFFDLVVPEAR